MSRALVVVDVQNDFCEVGSLAVEGGRYVAVEISEYLVGNRDEYAFVVATRDAHIDPGSHFSDEPDFVDSWPPHCVLGTAGAAIRSELADVALDAVFDKGAHEAAYSGFEGTTDVDGNPVSLAEWLRAHDVDGIDVCGLATDYCVRATCLDGVKAGFQVRLLEDLSAPVHPDTVEDILQQLSTAGVDVIRADAA